MSDDVITREEFKLFAKNTTDCLKQLTQNSTEIKDYMIHNDYRHKDADKRAASQDDRATMQDATIAVMGEDIAHILKIVSQRDTFFNYLKNLGKLGKFIAGAALIAVITLSVTALYGYMTKAPTEIKSKVVSNDSH